MKAEFFSPTLDYLDALVEVEKLAWSARGEHVKASIEKIKARVSGQIDGQSVVLALVDGKAAGSQYAFRFNWGGDLNSLNSWDEATSEGWTNKVHVPLGNTGFLVGVGVAPEFRGKFVEHNLSWPGKYKISELLIAQTLCNLFSSTAGVERVIANARIPWRCKMPSLNVHEYCALRRDDGTLFDPVIRFHERMGARIIKPVEFSMEDEESLNGGCWVIYERAFLE